MATKFGVHTGLQNTTIPELTSLWTRIEEGPFDWISIWDHFYAADFSGTHCHEAVAAHAALAMTTKRVEVGSLVYCAAYRHPAVLANSIVTIDHLSGGRAAMGLGAGWAKYEFDAYGIPFLPPKQRLDMLEESVQCVSGLLRNKTTDFTGEYFNLNNAVLDPKPLRENLPIWLGGGGEKRTLKIVGKYADGWNVPFVSPEVFTHKREVLTGYAEAQGRSIDDITTAVNVGLCPTEADFEEQFGGLGPAVRDGVLMGSLEQMVDHLGRYIDAGVKQINLALRAPWQLDRLETMAAAIESMR